MTNIAPIVTNSQFLDELDKLTSFDTWQFSSGRSGFTFIVLVTAEEFLLFMQALVPFVEERAQFVVEYDNRSDREYGSLNIESRDPKHLQALGRAILAVYTRINEGAVPTAFESER